MGQVTENKELKIKNALMKIPFEVLGMFTVSLPALSLAVCFLTAMIFQFDQVNLTMCKVRNFIPSISAVTGATPQRYIWRTCIGLHATPRYAIGVMYYNFYMSQISVISEKRRSLFKTLVKTTFWTYTVENSCLLLVSIVANYENYPVHEKIFVVFMFTSSFHQLFVLILFRWLYSELPPKMQSSFRQKIIYFILCLLSTAGLVYFFIQHRIFCAANAFSWFSACEYGIAYFNIGFHFTAAQDFKGHVWCIGSLPQASSNGVALAPSHNKKQQ